MIADKKKTGYIIAVCSILLNLILFGIKYYAGKKSGSIAVIADAWHSLSDTLTSIIVILGLWIASRPPDQEHPYGHGRAESIASIIVATLLGMVGFEFIFESISRIADGVKVEYDSTVLIALIISVVSKEIIAQVSIRYGKRMKSESLVADGWHHRTDSISSGLIIIGVIFNYFWWFDSVMGIGVALMILWATYNIMKGSISTLLGEKPNPETINKVESIIRDVDSRISDIHNFKMHSYGTRKEMSLDFRLPASMSVDQAHDIATDVGIAVLEKTGIRTTIHTEPEHEKENSDEITDPVEKE